MEALRLCPPWSGVCWLVFWVSAAWRGGFARELPQTKAALSDMHGVFPSGKAARFGGTAGPEIPDLERDRSQGWSDQAGVGTGWICLRSLSVAEARRDPGSESLAWLVVLDPVLPISSWGVRLGAAGF